MVSWWQDRDESLSSVDEELKKTGLTISERSLGLGMTRAREGLAKGPRKLYLKVRSTHDIGAILEFKEIPRIYIW